MNTKTHRVFNEIEYLYQFLGPEYQPSKAIALNGLKDKHGYKTSGLRYQRDPFVVMLPLFKV